MRIIPLSSPGSAHLAHLEWSKSDGLRRLILTAYHNGARSLVVLENANSIQWSKEFDSYFGDITGQLEREVPEMLLFVRGSVENETDLVEAVSSGNVVGYGILRPRPLGSVVEGFVVPTRTSDVHYITCEAEISFNVPLTGQAVQVSLKGVPFMQQDGIVSRCADASLWIATSLIAGGHPEWTDCLVVTRNLVEGALQNFPSVQGRRVPSGGLGLYEMMLVLDHQGYDPILYRFDSEEEKAKSDYTVYRWIESGIPVILCLELENDLHTVVVCGHTFDPDAWWPGARMEYFPKLAAEDSWLCSSLWATQYLVLDDNYGPLLAMTRGSLRNRTFAAIVPLPTEAKIHLAAEDAEALVAGVIFATKGSLVAVADAENTEWLDWLKGGATRLKERFVLRTLLAQGRDVLQVFRETGYPTPLATAAENLALPELVWLVEISLPAIYGDKLKVGEVILDPKVASKFHRTGTESFLWVNLAGQYWVPSMPAPLYAKLEEPVGLFERWLGR